MNDEMNYQTKTQTIVDAIATPGGDNPRERAPWSGSFVVDSGEHSAIALEQTTARDFVLCGTLHYVGDMGLDEATFPDISEQAKEAARHLHGDELGRSDLASVPRFLRWFENPYGRHTPAALIHDHLIVGETPNGGTLGSDIAADRYFRYMLAAVGVPFLKRWILWAAVALRSRWAIGGRRRWTVVTWMVLAFIGMGTFVMAGQAILTDGQVPGSIDERLLLVLAALTPMAASALWGKQWGAGLVAALTAAWLIPPAVFAAFGYAIYWLIETMIHLFAEKPPAARHPSP